MTQVIFMPSFREQLREIRDYIKIDSEFQSRRVMAEILKTARRLATFPEIGAFVPELMSKRFREIHVFKYRIIYRFRKKTDEVHILAVVHAARSLSKQFFRRLT